MAILGNNSEVNNFPLPTGQGHIANQAAFVYTAGANEEVFSVSIYNGNYNNTGSTVTVTLRDISVSVAAGTVVHSEVFTGGNNPNSWQSLTLAAPVALVNGKDYTVSVYADSGQWGGGIDSVAWDGSKTLKLTGLSAVPVDYSAASTTAEGTISAYFETQTTSADLVVVRHTLRLTHNADVAGTPVICESADFALGVTAVLWPANNPVNAESASLVVAVDSLPTSTPRYDCTFTVEPSNAAGDTIHITYVDSVGDIKNTVDGTPLASTTFDSPVAMTC